ncbi:MAG: LytTR family transcriptional regulator DNA-binding domain-containing protein [Bacteroidota bacterium]
MSFEIFEKIIVECPIIFTTAFDEYAIKAFKHNSIDYLLKPIDLASLRQSIVKFKKHHLSNGIFIGDLWRSEKLIPKNYRRNFLIHYKDKLIPLNVDSFAIFFIEAGIVYGMLKSNERYCIDFTLEDLQEQLDPTHFFRVNRQAMLAFDCIDEVVTHFNGRLLLTVKVPFPVPLYVSKERSTIFKKWFENVE